MWSEANTPDMIVKVTDICSTDPADPTHCADPTYIKVDRAKVQVLYQIPSPGASNPDLQQPVYPRGVYWHFTKCWTGALPQPAYAENWWAQPTLPNNFQWDVDATQSQMKNNQQSYPARNWTTYPDGSEIPTADSEAAIVPITDWVAGQEPAWAPIAGGKGYGTPERSCGPPPVLYPGQSTANAKANGPCNNGTAGGAAAGGQASSPSSSSSFPLPPANSTTSSPPPPPGTRRSRQR